MKKKGVIAALTMVAAGMASAIIMDGGTFPNTWVYDGLITYDHMGLPLVPNALHVNVGAGYMMASEMFDEKSEAKDMNADWKFMAVPVDVGYAINQRILVDVTLQVLGNWWEYDYWPGDSAVGLGDIWIKGRYIAPLDSFNLGGRLGIKVPVGKVDYYYDDDPELGDGQVDIDVAAVGSLYPEKGFAFNGQVGFRYRMKETVEEEREPSEYYYKPGTLVYLHLEPGYSVGPDNFQIYVPIGFMATTTAKVDAPGYPEEEVEDSNTNGLYIGLAPKYGLDANNTLGVKLLYPIVGTGGEDIPYLFKSMLIGLNYEGYIPF